MTTLLASWWLRFGVLALLFGGVLATRLATVPAILWSIALGAATAIGVGMIRLSARERGDLRLVGRADELHSPRDGDVVAVCGKLEPAGDVLESPILRKPSVLYYYNAYHFVGVSSSNAPNERVDYAGYGAIPAVVRGRNVTARLGGFPYVDQIAEKGIDSSQAVANSDDFLRFAKFDPVPEGEMIEWTQIMEDMWDGRARKVRNFRSGEGHDLKQCIFAELSVPPASEVCVIGTWSGGAVIGTPARDLFLYLGPVETVRRKLSSSIGCGSILGLLLIAGSIATAIYLAGI